METIRYTTKGTCSRAIEIDLEGETVLDVRFEGGCSGNTQGVGALCRGRNADEVIKVLSGLKCGPKPTSCPDQLAEALRAHFAK